MTFESESSLDEREGPSHEDTLHPRVKRPKKHTP